MGFYDNIKTVLDEDYNVSITENGAVGYKTSGKKLLDLNFAVASLRNKSESEIINMFKDAYYENPKYAILWLFFLRDVRGGLGERRSFRYILNSLAKENYEKMKNLIPLVVEYGRWDDLLLLLDTKFEKDAVAFIKNQINEDYSNYQKGNTCSLCAKWLPSANTSSSETRRKAKKLISGLGITEKKYRKTLSALRKYLNVVEVKMSSKEWSEIKYSSVSSKANLIYNDAFLRNDENRRREYLSKLKKGEEKINASVLYPHDIVSKYMQIPLYQMSKGERINATLEALWKALPNTVTKDSKTIVVADGSGSMKACIGGSGVTALSVANALAIYFSERLDGEFKDKYITFSNTPKLVNMGNAPTLLEKIMIALRHAEVADTNIEAVFDLILKTAVNNHMNQEDVPQNILIISDMEFNAAVSHANEKLFKTIEYKYSNCGYKLPRIIFWNVNSRTNTIPIRENELGVALVSGFSVNIARMVMSGKLDPYQCLIEQLDAERYEPVAKAIS